MISYYFTWKPSKNGFNLFDEYEGDGTYDIEYALEENFINVPDNEIINNDREGFKSEYNPAYSVTIVIDKQTFKDDKFKLTFIDDGLKCVSQRIRDLLFHSISKKHIYV